MVLRHLGYVFFNEEDVMLLVRSNSKYKLSLHKQNNSLRYVFHDMSFTVAPPKNSGNNEEAV